MAETNETNSCHPAVPSTGKGDVESESREYDEDLGRRMGRDARRVADGDLSEAEFFERYHDEVVAEFGFDKRITEPEESTDV